MVTKFDVRIQPDCQRSKWAQRTAEIIADEVTVASDFSGDRCVLAEFAELHDKSANPPTLLITTPSPVG